MGQHQSRRIAARAFFPIIAVVLVGISTPALGKVDRPVLKTFFETGDVPTQQQFATFIDSAVAGNLSSYVEDRHIIGLRQYDPTKVYLPGDTAIALKRFGIGDTTPVGPEGYLNPDTTPFALSPDFAGQSGFLAFQAADSSGVYYGYVQIQMNSAGGGGGGGATLTADSLDALIADPPEIHVEYVSYSTTPGVGIPMVALPEPTGAAALFIGAAALLRRRRSRI